MGRNKEEEARREGMAYAYDFAKKNGIEALEKELKMRNATKMPLSVNKKVTDDVINMLSENCRQTVMCLIAYTIHDKFRFGKKRLQQLLDAFEENTGYLLDGYISWNDIITIMKDECGIDYEIDDSIIQLSIENAENKSSEMMKQ